MSAGAAALVWCAVLVSDAVMAQRVARSSLVAVSLVERPVLAPALAPAMEVPPREATEGPPRDPAIARGSAIAALSIPRVHLSAVVLHGSDAHTLRRGPGHLEHTALPGEPGNMAIAGHRDSFFRPLRNVRLGDDIFVDAPQGRVHYRVTWLRVVKPHDLSVLEPTDDSTLTLITCYPFWMLGNAPDRFIVRATRVVDPTAAVLATPTMSPREPMRGPLVQAPAAPDVVIRPTRAAYDDETLVRHAIERFRLTYNARLISHNDVRPGGPLGFRTCGITIAGDQATATCGAASPSPDDREPPVWTLTLRRVNGGWAIRSTQSP